MIFTNKKYNIALAFLICAIVLIVSISSVGLMDGIQKGLPEVDAENIEEQEKNDNVGEDKIADVIIPRAPAFTTGWEAFEYAYKILETGKGFKSVQKREIGSSLAGIKASQKFEARIYKNSQATIHHIETRGEAPLGIGGYMDNTYYLAVIKDENLYIKQCPVNDKSLIDSVGFWKGSAKDYYNETGIKHGTGLLKIDKRSASLKSFSLNKGIYTVTFALNINSGAWQDCLKIAKTAQMQNPLIQSISVTYTIDAKTGFFLKMDQIAKYDARLGILNIQNCIDSITETFTSMDKDFDMAIPELPI